MEPAITVVIPTLPGREDLLARAIRSVAAQTRQPDHIIIELDEDRCGEHLPRNRGLAKVDTEYVAWLDDDDEFLPRHLELLLLAARHSGADLVHSDYQIIGGGDHRPTFIQVTNLAKTAAVRKVGGFPQPYSDTFPYRYSDWGLLALMLRTGARFEFVPHVTWRYHIHDGNTVGTGFGPDMLMPGSATNGAGHLGDATTIRELICADAHPQRVPSRVTDVEGDVNSGNGSQCKVA